METEIVDSRNSSPSPLATSSPSRGLDSAVKWRHDFLQPRQTTIYSPLRTEKNASKFYNTDNGADSDKTKDINGVSTSPPSVDGFPFHAISHSVHAGTNEMGENESILGNMGVGSLVNANERAVPARSASDTLVQPLEKPVRKKSNLAGSSTPPGRRSVQFARPAPDFDEPDKLRSRAASFSLHEEETPLKDRRGGSLLTKIRALAGSSSRQTHTRSPSAFTVGGDSIDERLPTGGLFTADADRQQPYFADSPDEDEGEADADGEQSTADDTEPTANGRSKRRKSRRPQDGGIQTAPTTPKTPFMRDKRPKAPMSNSATTTDGQFRPSFPPRRATMTDVPMGDRQGVSEDEGRERLSRESPWKRGSAWVHSPRGMSYSGVRSRSNQQSGTETPRPSTFRRALTGFGGSGEGIEGSPFSPWKLRGERTSTLSAAKWRQIKAGLKMMGQRRKADNTIDHAKSAELLAELTAGVPAALILASMFQRDEHGRRKIPVLLEQLKVKLTDSKHVDAKSGDRHMIFRIELEYGNGLTRMKWVIHRALRDFANLHARYKLQISAQKYIQRKDHEARTKLPHFPRSAFPYLRGIRGLDSESEGEEDLDGEGSGPSGGNGSASERPGKKRRSRPSMSIIRRMSSGVGAAAADSIGGAIAAAGGAASAVAVAGATNRKDPFAERQRRKLELYLQQMIRYLIFRPESNRLCKFLELSALGVRLAAEGSYHGKEGLLVLQSGKGVDFRKRWTPTLLKARHGPKWFLVRHSYVVCVDSPEEMNIYDVFLVDSDFKIQTKKRRPPIRDQKPKEIAKAAKDSAAHPQNHTLKLHNSERKLRLLAKNERQLHQFEDSIRFMSTNSPWVKRNRFDSFAPIRPSVFAQWLVDGRDYMWNVSRAISMAKDVIYIHDWWLSPELYMRRPAAISQKWRLDRLLQRKAQEGVKVFVIMYRNIQSAIPIDSEYSKFSLLDLHPNVFVQRSPNQIRQGTFFWAHHEKICIVDHMVAFVGGIDLCFGRWDTPQHTVVDDKLTGFEQSDMPKDADHCQLWPGKDYSNPRVQDFYALDKPYEEMYDRAKICRMPWHDISMQVVGQPARDLTRHFVQRWNYILRQRRPTRPTPFLLPPPDFNPADLEALGLDGTCEVQILRSCCMWSMGTPDRVEHSIMTAYIKMIQQSDHFVYIENQFFVTSTEVEGTKIENTIGDALVERIIRAYQSNEAWRAVVVIPLLPGFQNTVDDSDGSSVRLIMQCQFRSISRGDQSIYGRLRTEGIEPEDYINFFSLRSWGKIGPAKQLVTEQLYIHAKCIIVDDRIALIGSANINERSMLGSRDSEAAAVVRDTDMLWSTMAGEPYMVGRFPHTLRMRLMREHLGIDVDEVMNEEKEEQNHEEWVKEMDEFHGEHQSSADRQADLDIDIDTKHKIQDELLAKSEDMRSFNHDIDWEQANNPNLKANKKVTSDKRVTGNINHRKDVEGEGTDHFRDQKSTKVSRGRNPIAENKLPKNFTLLPQNQAGVSTSTVASRTTTESPARKSEAADVLPLPPQMPRMSTYQLGLPMLSHLPALPKTDDTDIGGPSLQRVFSKSSAGIVNPVIADMKRPMVDKDCMRDPLNDSFYIDTWLAIAENNTKLFRTVFRCMPDNEVKTWKEYKEYAAYTERFIQAQGGGKSKDRVTQEVQGSTGPPGQVNVADRLRILGAIGEKAGDVLEATGDFGSKTMDMLPGKHTDEKNKPTGKAEDWAEEANKIQKEREEREAKSKQLGGHLDEKASSPTANDTTLHDITGPKLDSGRHAVPEAPPSQGYSEALNANSQKRRRRGMTRGSKKEFRASDDMINTADAEELLKMVQGALVVWPSDWLVKEEQGGNFVYSIDQLAPLEIYN
ncbi:Phospholipase D1 [Lambiella insularis]|nr:Phospholipase D1 [Lambiella insularis]